MDVPVEADGIVVGAGHLVVDNHNLVAVPVDIALPASMSIIKTVFSTLLNCLFIFLS